MIAKQVLLCAAFSASLMGQATAEELTKKENYEFYPIKATTSQELYEQLKKEGPPFPPIKRTKEHWAYTTWDPDIAKGCKTVTVTNNYILPKWVNRDDAPILVRKNWDRMYRALLRHEKGHGRINFRAGKKILQSPCSQKSRHRNNRRKLNKLYDKITNHGAFAGAFLFRNPFKVLAAKRHKRN